MTVANRLLARREHCQAVDIAGTMGIEARITNARVDTAWRMAPDYALQRMANGTATPMPGRLRAPYMRPVALG